MTNPKVPASRRAAAETAEPTSRPEARPRPWVVGLVALCIGMFAPEAGIAAEPEDVPPDHWARSSVLRVLDRGLMGTLDDGTFRGEQAVTRFDLAVLADRLLQQGETSGDPLREADFAALRELVDRFRRDVVAYYESRDDLVRQIRITRETIDIFDDTMNLVLSRLDRMQEAHREQERRWQAAVDDLGAQVAALEAANEELARRLAALEARAFAEPEGDAGPAPESEGETGGAPESEGETGAP